MRRATITGWGRCVPPAVLTNSDLATVMDTSDEWISTRTGIKERRITHTETSDMAAVAGRHALAAAGLEPEQIDLLVLATCTPDRIIPSAASYVQPKLGLSNAACMDVNAACSGFVYGMALANGMIAAGSFSKILLIGAEKLSMLLDVDERSTAVLFGDGAGAVVIEPSEDDEGVLSLTLGTDGGLADKLTVSGFGTERLDKDKEHFRLVMDGQEVFRHAVTQMGDAAARVIADAGLELDDIDLLIPHQANTRIIDATARRLKMPYEKVFLNIASYGNTSAASIPIALSEAIELGRVRPGANLVMVAFGGGLTWGALVLRFGSRVTPLAMSNAALPPTDQSGLELLAEVQEERRRRRGVA
ncbi:MAG: beta-ketoacyl-ACP synthase III [Acidimicrobiia bacterium]